MPMPNRPTQRHIRLTSTLNLPPFIDYCEEKGLDWRNLAKQCSMPTDVMLKRDWLLARNIMRFISCIEQELGPSIGLDIGQSFTIESMPKQLNDIIQTSSNIETALVKLVDFLSVMNNYIMIWTEYIDGEWWLCHRSGYSPSTPGVAQVEWYRTYQLIIFCRAFYGKNWSPNKIKVMGKPNSHASERHFPGSHIETNCDFAAISIELSGQPLYIQRETTSTDLNRGLQHLIESYALLPWFTIDWFANFLGTTPRTLQRQLGKQALTFKELKEQTRKAHAVELLTTSGLPISDIAWESGYCDLSNFNRAFKTWTGSTPSLFRRNHQSV
ncbi:AraC family transcriptional regulator [Vibrio sp. FNV 38]|nr:AraC family transcriptional regulator [Vibrio sp. FNV 38]